MSVMSAEAKKNASASPTIDKPVLIAASISDDATDCVPTPKLRAGDRHFTIQNGSTVWHDEPASFSSATLRQSSRALFSLLTKISATDMHAPSYASNSNMVTTSRYTWYNFVVLNLFEQFHNVANIYFLLVGALQCISAVSTTNGLPTMYYPLAFIVSVSGLRSAKEDYDKHQADFKRNSKVFDVLKANQQYASTCSGMLRAGDIVRIKQDDMVPADCLLLSSSDSKGQCFIDKANLNGETRLEVMNSILLTRTACSNTRELTDSEISLIFEAPNKYFDSFRGHLSVQSADGSNKRSSSIDGKSLLMRETILRNTDHILGLIVYTGSETKIRRSSSEGDPPRHKSSAITKFVEKCLLVMLLIQLALCAFGGIMAGVYADWLQDHWYLDTESENDSYTGLLAFFTWFILLASMLPISLVVSSEMVKFAQSIFIQWDISLYSTALNKKARCNSSTVHEDLGRVDYIFSDKTGTLTQNRMEFRYALLQCQPDVIVNSPASPSNSISSSSSSSSHLEQTPSDKCLEAIEFGSKDTDIAKSVRARKADLQHRLQSAKLGVEASSAPARISSSTWLELETPLYAGSDEQDLKIRNSFLRRKLPFFFRHLWDSTETVQKYEVYDRELRRRKVHAVHAVSPSVPSTIIPHHPSPSLVATFSHEEREQLLRALWGPKLDSEDEQQCLHRQRYIYQYLTHMALSNTVKPYESQGKLKFQAESAEELAMVEFAHSLGFTKRSINPTVLEVTCFEASDAARQHPIVHIEAFDVLATLGFTSKRSRVTIIYKQLRHNVASPRSHRCPSQSPSDQPFGDTEVVIMTKGQDSVILPLIALERAQQKATATALKDMAANGMRTLVCAHADQSLLWWNAHEANYKAVAALDVSDASSGHPEKCRHIDGGCERCLQHQAFEIIEQSAALRFGGVVGLEDQLQLLVPECVADCLSAGIKVWMITGDKLDTAKNIGLACNLIDADMLPQSDEQQMETSNVWLPNMAASLAQSRLVEVTGKWLEMQERTELIDRLFEQLDTDSDEAIFVHDLQPLLNALGIVYSNSILTEAIGMPFMDRLQFHRFLQDTLISKLEAIRFDIEAGWQRYSRVQDHSLYPVSLLIDRAAFQVLFPTTIAAKVKSSSPSSPAASDLLSSSAPASTLSSNALGSSPGISSSQELVSLRNRVFDFTHNCKSVVFARAEPAMKKQMVCEIQARHPKMVTLAIGDGANDSEMIQAADIGVGIAGVEGTAATQSAEYAIGSFRHLHTLLFVHGYWSNQRTTKLVTFIFYKASLVALAMFLFGFLSAFSGQQLFDDPVYQIYNVMYTALPVIAVAILDQPLTASVLQNQPLAYRYARDYPALSAVSFSAWIARAFVHAVTLFWIPYFIIGQTDVSFQSGRNGGMWFFSTVVYTSVAGIANLLVLFEMVSISLLQLSAVLLSILAILLVDYVINSNLFEFYDHNLYSIVNEIYSSPNAWLTILINLSVPLLIEACWRAYQVEFHPTMAQTLTEQAPQSPQTVIGASNNESTHEHAVAITSAVELTSSKSMSAGAVVQQSRESSIEQIQPAALLASQARSNVVQALLRLLASVGPMLEKQHHVKSETAAPPVLVKSNSLVEALDITERRESALPSAELAPPTSHVRLSSRDATNEVEAAGSEHLPGRLSLSGQNLFSPSSS